VPILFQNTDYDAATLAPTATAPSEFHTALFPITDPSIPTAAATLVKLLREKHYYTDTQNFDLRCQVRPSIAFRLSVRGEADS
jgi:ubiquitin thioesterase OTU1